VNIDNVNYFVLFRRKAVSLRVRRLRPSLRQQLGPEEALARAHLGQTLLLQGARLRQVLHAPLLSTKTHQGPLQVADAHQDELVLLGGWHSSVFFVARVR